MVPGLLSDPPGATINVFPVSSCPLPVATKSIVNNKNRLIDQNRLVDIKREDDKFDFIIMLDKLFLYDPTIKFFMVSWSKQNYYKISKRLILFATPQSIILLSQNLDKKVAT